MKDAILWPLPLLSEEILGLLTIGSLLLIGVFTVASFYIRRKYGGESQRGIDVPPIPQRAEYDSSLSPDERRSELELMENLMGAPAYGEGPSGDEKDAGEPEG